MSDKNHDEKVERPQDLEPEDEVKGGRTRPDLNAANSGDKEGVIVTDGGVSKDGVIVTD